MPDNDFGFVADAGQPGPGTGASGCTGVCPLARIPEKVWLSLLKPPFRKRHPIIFWGLAIILIVIALLGLKWWTSSEKGLDGSARLALVTVQGPIMDVGPTLKWIRKIENSPSIKGVLLRVNSPGGGAAASQEIYSALARLAKKIPVVVSMGATAASGGLMVSMAGERIFANPSTVTGSIGVRMDIPQLEGLMDKIGIGQETLVTAPYKDAASYTHPLTPGDRAYLEEVLKNMHEQFVDIVATGRHMPRDKAASLANGKIFTGQEALRLGLVDAMGGQYEAHEWLAQKTGIPANRSLAAMPSPRKKILESFLGMLEIAGLPDQASGKLEEITEKLTQPAFLYQFF